MRAGCHALMLIKPVGKEMRSLPDRSPKPGALLHVILFYPIVNKILCSMLGLHLLLLLESIVLVHVLICVGEIGKRSKRQMEMEQESRSREDPKANIKGPDKRKVRPMHSLYLCELTAIIVVVLHV